MIDTTVALAVAVVVLLIVVFSAGFLKRRPRQLDDAFFQTRWKEAQGYCKDKSTWPLAVITADKLLDEGLKRRRFKGKTMGERMVAAQREMSDNDGMWYAHKLRNRLVHETDVPLKEADVRKALVGIRQALKDLGAKV